MPYALLALAVLWSQTHPGLPAVGLKNSAIGAINTSELPVLAMSLRDTEDDEAPVERELWR